MKTTQLNELGELMESVKDANGSGATDPDGILNVATRAVVAEAGDAIVVQTDLCLDEFTDHGHCGVLGAPDASGTPTVDNDATLERYVAMALAQAEAGSQLRRTATSPVLSTDAP